jgi:hypothetical protein
MKYLRPHIKIPFYWGTYIINLKDEEAGRLVRAIMDYSFLGIEPTHERLHGAEWAIWPMCKKDLDWQFKHPRAYRYPTDEAMMVRNSNEYKAWRDAVFERDDYTCQYCKKRGGKLNAHHIKRFSKFPELRMELTNGITLCSDCHHAVHRGEIECPTGS